MCVILGKEKQVDQNIEKNYMERGECYLKRKFLQLFFFWGFKLTTKDDLRALNTTKIWRRDWWGWIFCCCCNASKDSTTRDNGDPYVQ
jgi:hypothetical protein